MSTEKHDLIIIGGGPAGLTAALTAEANGIDTLVLDCSNLGGQAATATLIENYPGFPDGISGDQLMSNIVDQALRFTTEFEAPSRVTSLQETAEGIQVTTENESRYLGTTAIISTGLEQRLLPARNLAAYTNRGVTYGSPHRITQYEDKNFIIVGGSDAATQAAVHLSNFPGCNVTMLVRGSGLEKRTSQHLIEKAHQKANITVLPLTELMSVDGDGRLNKAVVKTGDDESREIPVDELFILIGLEPRTAWLGEVVLRDRTGFIVAGTAMPETERSRFIAKTKGRQPYAHETSMPGTFVAGDVRSGSGKWVTLAVSDGAAVIPELQALEIYNRLHR